MKVGIEQAPSEFKPITLTISFETKEEFEHYKMINNCISGYNIQQALDARHRDKFNLEIWADTIANIAIKLGKI